jgi:O-antigen/teichoic acid export membrane protein
MALKANSFLSPGAKDPLQAGVSAPAGDTATGDGAANSIPSPRRPFSGATIWVRARQLWALARLTPFDVSTEAGRSKERYRRAALTTVASGSAKGIAILTGLISVPLTVKYLGLERYGLWMTISSVIVMLGFADLGMGNGLLNAIAEANGRDDREAARRYVSSGFFMLLGTATLVLSVFTLAYRFIPWPRVFNVASAVARREAGPAMVVFVVCFALNMPLGIVQRVQMGYQEGFVSYLWQMAGSLTGLGGLLVAMHLKSGLPWLVLAMSGGPLFASLLNWLAQFVWSRPWLFPRWRFSCTTAAQKIFGTGILFVILQLASAFAFATDNIVVAQVLGPGAVTQYAVPMKMFAVLGVAAALMYAPLWPAYGEAVARGDVEWVKRTLVRSLGMTLLLCGLPAVVLVFWGKAIVHLWVGPEIQPPFLLLLGMGIWAVLVGLGSALAMFLNGANILKFQVVCAALMAGAALVLKIWLAKQAGVAGVIWGTVIAYSVFSALPMIFYVPWVLNDLRRSRGRARV